jgi:hypothetical protein
MGTLELMPSCALLNKFTHSSHSCVVYNVPIQSDTANKRMVADIGITDNGLESERVERLQYNKYSTISYNVINELFSA